jgi:hypothetical protein
VDKASENKGVKRRRLGEGRPTGMNEDEKNTIQNALKKCPLPTGDVMIPFYI